MELGALLVWIKLGTVIDPSPYVEGLSSLGALLDLDFFLLYLIEDVSPADYVIPRLNEKVLAPLLSIPSYLKLIVSLEMSAYPGAPLCMLVPPEFEAMPLVALEWCE